uniref:Uncharacterized protein n=1 Tax=Micrurus lemniscatus lemniscatus TaxID=129467 RepID=A0A2D4HUH1_MICLE
MSDCSYRIFQSIRRTPTSKKWVEMSVRLIQRILRCVWGRIGEAPISCYKTGSSGGEWVTVNGLWGQTGRSCNERVALNRLQPWQTGRGSSEWAAANGSRQQQKGQMNTGWILGGRSRFFPPFPPQKLGVSYTLECLIL